VSLLVGVDVGGTKTQIKVVRATAGADDPVLADEILPSTGWSAVPAGGAGDWLVERIRSVVSGALAASPDEGVAGASAAVLPDSAIAHLAVGAHGCENQQHCDDLAGELCSQLGVDCTVVNDAQLLVPAAGLTAGIGLVAGTGSIAVGRRAANGAALSAGGWGWVLGDDGSASALVREAAKALMRRADVGAEPDVLERHLTESFGVTDLVELSLIMSWDGGVETWGQHARAVFAAASAGSPVASGVIADGARELARLVAALVDRGAVGTDIVAAGGVVTAQESLRRALETALAELAPGMRLRLLNRPPVDGAVFLARAALADQGR
jgi:N-acetylglucosamine kinase-like BadF-type ATPase